MSTKTKKEDSEEKALGAEYMLFLKTDEKLTYNAKGVFENTIEGHLVLTNKRLFFYYVSNISRDKVFISMLPNIKSVKLKNSILHSELIIDSRAKSFNIKKMNKKEAKEFSEKLKRIIKDNK